MIQFTVTGTPCPQGSKTAMIPTGRNADIESAIEWLRIALADELLHADATQNSANNRTELDGLITRLAGVKRWPIRKGRWLINLVESNAKKLHPWRKAVAAAAREAYHGEPMTGAVSVRVTFWFRRPLSHFRTGKFSHLLKGTAPERHTSFPDADKLLRAVLDAMTGIVYVDDKQVDDPHPVKRWLPNREDPECAVIDVF